MTSVFFTLLGSHAGESLESIIKRKQHDIYNTVGYTLWFFKRNASCNPEDFYNLNVTTAYGLLPKTPNTCKNTKVSKIATQFYFADSGWINFPKNLSPVTGNIVKNSIALHIRGIKIVNKTIDLNIYEDINDDKVLRFNQFASSKIGSFKGQGMITPYFRTAYIQFTLDKTNPVVFIK